MDKISTLQKDLKEKQVLVAMEEVTVNGVAFSDETTITKLGPTIYSEVSVNGEKVMALIDTGSPVTLMSLNKAIQILALRKGEFSFPTRMERSHDGPISDTYSDAQELQW